MIRVRMSELPVAGHLSWRELLLSDVRAWEGIWLQPDALRKRHRRFEAARLVWAYPGLRATLLYRLSFVLFRARVRVLPQMLCRLNTMLHGLDIPSSVEIGPGLYIPHPVGTVIMARRIGSRVTIVSAVTIGLRNGPPIPTIGDDVYIGAGARILGGIKIGNRARIGANAVVLQDVPDDYVAVGVPASVRPPRQQGAVEPGASREGSADAER